MGMNPSIYPLYGLAYLVMVPDLLARVLGLVVMELLVPLYWVSNTMVDAHHTQIFDAVMAREMGATKPISPLAPEQRARVHALVAKNRGHLRDDDTNLSAKIQEKTRDPRVPGFVRVLLWIVTPPSPRAPIGEKILRRVVNLPSGLLFPAAAKLLGAGNARSLAAHAIRPYLKKKGIKTPEEQAAVAYEHRWDFRAFGITAYVLGFVPLLSWILNFATSVGAALWAADMERSGQFTRLL